MFIIIFFIIFSNIFSQECIFQDIDWEIEKIENRIILKTNVCNNLLFSRAEVNIYKSKKDEINYLFDLLIKNLTDYDNYSVIFPKTDKFIEIEKINNNRAIFYAQLDFSPFKKREYYVDLSIIKNENEFVMYWKPLDEKLFDKYYKKNTNINVRYVYGKWTVGKRDNGVFVSVEYHNDWLINNVPKQILWKFEKSSTVNALKNLLKYSKVNLE